MLGLKVSKEFAEKAKRYLRVHALLSNNNRILRNNSFIYLPLSSKPESRVGDYLRKNFRARIVDTGFGKKESRSDYRETLLELLGKREYEKARKSYDILGNIAIIDAEGRTARKLAEAILTTNRNVKTVLRKGGAISGRYRTRKYYHVMGKRNYTARYRENGAVFEFDVRKTYFSTRLAYERQRIVNKVKDGERVMVMFAGIGPFAIEIARARKRARVVAIEINRNAYRYMLNNIRMNKTPNVVPELGDVKRIANKYPHFADRIIMPLPKESYKFLDSVLKVAKNGCVVHYYAFGDSRSAYEEHAKKLTEFFRKHGRRIGIIDKRIVRPYSSTEIEVVLDVRVDRATL
jgi:tRNA (guanine37-N1)-methyltransferase